MKVRPKFLPRGVSCCFEFLAWDIAKIVMLTFTVDPFDCLIDLGFALISCDSEIPKYPIKS